MRRVLAIVIGCTLGGTAGADDLTVCPPRGEKPPDCHATIAQAVATANPGDVILVPPGQYVEDVRLEDGRDLTIRGTAADDADWPEILGQMRVFDSQVRLEAVHVEGQRIVDGEVEGDRALIGRGSTIHMKHARLRGRDSGRSLGGAAYFEDCVDVDFEHVTVFDGGVTTRGGLVFLRRSNFRGLHVSFRGGQAGNHGGGLYAEDASTVTLEDSDFEDNNAALGSAIYIRDSDASLRGISARGGSSIDPRSSTLQFENAHVDITRSHLCTLTGTDVLIRATEVQGTWRNNALVGRGPQGIQVQAVEQEGRAFGLDISNNHFVDLGSLGRLRGEVQFTDNLLLDLDDHEPLALDEQASQGFNHVENRGIVYDLLTGEAIADGPNDLARLASSRGECPDWGDLVHGFDGGLVDAGSGRRSDIDGTINDIGAFGGVEFLIDPESSARELRDDFWLAYWSDDDGDGSPNLYDCRDNNADVYPFAPEIPGDGIDQDCDGEDDAPRFATALRCDSGAATASVTPWLLGGLLCLFARRRSTRAG
jgi:hypothetical protein